MCHALLVVPIAFQSLNLPELDHDRAFGWDDSIAKLYAISSGCIYVLIPTALALSHVGCAVTDIFYGIV